jgi:hypothetical protein
MMPCGWLVRNCLQVGPVRRGAGSTSAVWRISHTVEAAIQCPSRVSPWILRSPPPGILPRQVQDESLDPCVCLGASETSALRDVVPSGGDEPAMPGEQRRGCDWEGVAPAASRYLGGPRCEPEAVNWFVADPALQLAAQDGVLVAQHEQLGIFGDVAAQDDRGDGQQPAGHPVKQSPTDDLSAPRAYRCELPR